MPRCPACGLRTGGDCPRCGAPAAAPAPHAPPPPPTVEGFEVEGALGRGGFGAVHAARRLADGRAVALKVARAGAADAARQLAREAEALAALGPPHAPALLGEGRLADGTPYLALERVDLPALAQLLEAARGPLEPGRAVAAGLALLDALAALHARGWAHGDVKPENVLLGEDRAVLLDLGLAERAGAAPAPRPAPDETAAGTTEYLSPERIAGSPPDARGDVYGAGVVLYELLTGAPPFHGPAAEVRRAHLERRPRPPSELAPVPPAVEAVVLRCLAKAPAPA